MTNRLDRAQGGGVAGNGWHVYFLYHLVEWPKQALKKGSSMTTIQIYFRNLRTIFNKAIKEGYISERHYPFKSYTIGMSAKSKSVLYAPDLKKLWEYQPKSATERRAKDLFFFVYMANGMNFKDAAYLRFKTIRGNTLYFVREKTKNTNTITGKEIPVYMHDEMKKIIERWGNTSQNPNDYIFPILQDGLTFKQKEDKRKAFQRRVNAKLKLIGEKLGFDVVLRLGLARHSFATHLKLSGTPTSFISDALGHSNSKTTEHYLKSIPNEKAQQISDSLLKFD